MLALSHYAHVADSHRIKAINADTEHERMHWDGEAHRFEQLAEMERTDPAAARAAYRPTSAYDPTIPHVRDYGVELAVTTSGQGTGLFDRDKLATAYLLHLMAPAAMGSREQARTVADTLRTEHGFTKPAEAVRYALAAHYLIRANISL